MWELLHSLIDALCNLLRPAVCMGVSILILVLAILINLFPAAFLEAQTEPTGPISVASYYCPECGLVMDLYVKKGEGFA